MGTEVRKWLPPGSRGNWLERNIRGFSCFGCWLHGHNNCQVHQMQHLICTHFTVHKLYLNTKKGIGGGNSAGNGKQITRLEIVISTWKILSPPWWAWRRLVWAGMRHTQVSSQHFIPPQGAAATGGFLHLGRELLTRAIFRRWQAACAFSFSHHIE